MSGAYQRNREVSEYKFFTQAIAIRVEVNKLMASSSVVPKAYRLLNAVPTVETARSIVYNVNRAKTFWRAATYAGVSSASTCGSAVSCATSVQCTSPSAWCRSRCPRTPSCPR